MGFAQAVWDCERESSVKDTIRQGVKGRGGEEWMAGRAGEDVLEGKERKQTEEIRKECQRGFKATLKQNAQKCTVAKFLFHIRKCTKAWRKGRWKQRADRKGPMHVLIESLAIIQQILCICSLCVLCVCQTDRESGRERKQMGGVYWLHIVYSLSTG